MWAFTTLPDCIGCHNSHDVTYTSQLITQKELLFNISCKIAYFFNCMFCYINLYYYYLAICTPVQSYATSLCHSKVKIDIPVE